MSLSPSKTLLKAAALALVCVCAVRAQPATGPVVVDLSSVKLERMLVLSQTARAPVAVAEAAPRVTLRAGEYLTGRTSEQLEVSKTASALRFRLPYKIVGADTVGQKVELSPVVEVEGGGLRFRPDQDIFVGTLQVGLENTLNPGSSASLGRNVQMLLTAAADTVSPGSVTFNHTNLPFRAIEITARRPGDVIAVRIRPEFDPDGLELEIPVQRPNLQLTVSPQRIQGLGLETADVTVSLPSGFGGGPVSVLLTSDGTRPEPSLLTVEDGGTAVASIRSRGLGDVVVTASTDVLAPATASVAFIPPWGFGLAAAAGGLLGAFVRYFMPLMGSRKKPQPRDLAIQVVVGVLAGLLTATAYAVGLNFLEVSPSAVVGEALVFTLAALGALASATLFAQRTSTATPNIG